MNLSQYTKAHYQDELDDMVGDLTWTEFCTLLKLDETDDPVDPLDWLDAHDEGGAWRFRLEIALAQKVLDRLAAQYKEEGT